MTDDLTARDRNASPGRGPALLPAPRLGGLLAFSSGTAAAATTPGGDATFTQNGKGADAGTFDCLSNGDGTTTCIEGGLSVFAGKESDNFSGVSHVNAVCAWLNSATFDDETGEYVGEPTSENGCRVDLPKTSLKFGRNLSSVTLAPTTITLSQWICTDKTTCEQGPSRDVTVQGAWTGDGPTTYGKYRFTGADDTCRYNESGKGYDRGATFVGSVDGTSLDQAYASITSGKSTYRSRCIEPKGFVHDRRPSPDHGEGLLLLPPSETGRSGDRLGIRGVELVEHAWGGWWTMARHG